MTLPTRWTATLVLLLAVDGPATAAESPADPAATVATVNGDAITAREFVEALRRGRFRHRDLTELRRVALDECVRWTVTLQLAREHGIVSDVSDAALRGAFVEENARRAATLAHGGVVYGPRRLTWEQFRATWFDDLERKLGHALLARTNTASPPAADPNAALKAVEATVIAAQANAKVQADQATIARLEPNTALPAEATR